ncbi:MAG: hypothetical protein MR557_08185, partial [Faecalibacterium sp.]|nr:hypothetical protein [Faecalibacterium sp.]
GDRRAKKITGAGEGESLSLTRLLLRYRTVKELHEEKGYTVRDLCPLVHIARSSYYKWLKHPKSSHELENEKISTAIQKIYKEHPDKRHRRTGTDRCLRQTHEGRRARLKHRHKGNVCGQKASSVGNCAKVVYV